MFKQLASGAMMERQILSLEADCLRYRGDLNQSQAKVEKMNRMMIDMRKKDINITEQLHWWELLT